MGHMARDCPNKGAKGQKGAGDGGGANGSTLALKVPLLCTELGFPSGADPTLAVAGVTGQTLRLWQRESFAIWLHHVHKHLQAGFTQQGACGFCAACSHCSA